MRFARNTPGFARFVDKQIPVNSEGMVSVIVMFKNPPPFLRQKLAAESGSPISLEEAQRLAMEDHVIFKKEMDKIFTASGYTITSEYTNTINGVAVTIPANMVSEVAKIECVQSIQPNSIITIDPPPLRSQY